MLKGSFKYTLLILFLIFGSALMIRFTALRSLSETPYLNFLMPDEAVYDHWAKEIANNTYTPQTPYEFSPLPAYVMAVTYYVFGADIFHVRTLNILLGSFTCVVIALIAASLGDWPAGLLAGLVAAAYKPFILYSVVPLKTSLSLFLFSLIIYQFLLFLNRASLLRVALLGVLISLAYNVRGNYLVLAPVVGIAVALRFRGEKPSWSHVSAPLAIFLAAFTLAQAPFTIRNYFISNEFVLSTTQSGFNFYLGNNLRNPSPYYLPVAFASPSPFEQGVQFTIEASRRTGHDLTAQQASSFWYREALCETNENPTFALHRLALKLLAVFNYNEAADHYDTEFMTSLITPFRWPLFHFAIVWPLGLAGLLLGAALHNKGMQWLTVIFLSYTMTLLAFYVSSRYHVPLMVIVIPCMAAALRQIILAVRQPGNRRILFFYACTTLLFAALQLLPIPGAGDKTAYINFHAAALKSAGRLPEALALWQQSAMHNGTYSDFARLVLADHYVDQADPTASVRSLNQIPDNSFAAAYKYSALGDLYKAKRQYTEALACYNESLSLNSGQLGTRRKLINILANLQSPQAPSQIAMFHHIRSFYRGL